MDLTWRDAISTLVLVAMLVIYAEYLGGGLWLISSTWATSAVVLILGLGGRVISIRGDARVRYRERFHAILSVVATAFTVIALTFGLAALLADSAYALKILIMASIVVWAASLLSHV
jgi:hypothetical protein